jgi:hypothetical protein
VILVFSNPADGGDGEVLAGREGSEDAVLIAAEIDAGDDPDGTGVVGVEADDGVVGEAGFGGEGAKPPVAILREAVGRTDPEGAIGGGSQGSNGVGGEVAFRFIKCGELVAVEAGETLVGAEPEVAVGGLGNGTDGVLWQTILLSPEGAGILRGKLVRIERRGGQSQGAEENCDRWNRPKMMRWIDNFSISGKGGARSEERGARSPAVCADSGFNFFVEEGGFAREEIKRVADIGFQ